MKHLIRAATLALGVALASAGQAQQQPTAAVLVILAADHAPATAEFASMETCKAAIEQLYDEIRSNQFRSSNYGFRCVQK